MESNDRFPLEVNLIALLADLKEVDYKTTLLVSTVIDILIDKGICTRKEIYERMMELDADVAFTLGGGQYDARHPDIDWC
jgi:hypothetical protein